MGWVPQFSSPFGTSKGKGPCEVHRVEMKKACGNRLNSKALWMCFSDASSSANWRYKRSVGSYVGIDSNRGMLWYV